MQTYSFRQESWSKTYRDSGIKNSRSHSYENLQKQKNKKNVLETALDLQLYGGQGVGHEAAVHTVR